MESLNIGIEVALEREVEGDLFLQDIGQGFGFRPGTFDGAIRFDDSSSPPSYSPISGTLLIVPPSISVLQWLLNADSTSHSPPQRLARFFTTLHSSLRNPSRAVFQFYPSSDDQVQMITQSAQRAGFAGGLVVDYPNSKKARKMYLCLMVGQQEVPRGLDGGEIQMGVEDTARRREEIRNERRRRVEKSGKGKGKGKKGKDMKAKDWVLKKKDLYRTRGKEGSVLRSALLLCGVGD